MYNQKLIKYFNTISVIMNILVFIYKKKREYKYISFLKNTIIIKYFIYLK